MRTLLLLISVALAACQRHDAPTQMYRLECRVDSRLVYTSRPMSWIHRSEGGEYYNFGYRFSYSKAYNESCSIEPAPRNG